MKKLMEWLKRFSRGQEGQSFMLAVLSATVVGILAITLVNAFTPSIQTLTLDRARAMVVASSEDFTINGDLMATTGTFSGVLTVEGIGDGGLTSYDLKIGDTATPSYGVVQIGNSVIGRISYNVASVDLDGAVIFRNLGGPVTGKIEFLWEEGNGAIRFAIPSSGVGNATYNPRSMLLAGPAPADSDAVTVGYWQTTNSIFLNLAADTAGDGADLGVQNDLEVEGDIFTDSIKESTSGGGIWLQPLADSTAFFSVLDFDGGVPILSIDATNERVGIGTDTPEGVLDIVSTSGALIVPRMTTAQRDALTAVNGMILYNTTTNAFNFYEAGAWVTRN